MKGFCRGINLGGWLSQCDYSRERLENFIKKEDTDMIASWGLDHVRLPVDYNVIEDEGFGISGIRRAVDMALGSGLNVVLDLHKTPGYSFDKGENETGFFDSDRYQEVFYGLWERLAAEFGGDPGHIMFDLLNEIVDESVLKKWERIASECVRRIRKHAPDTYILIGSYNYNDVRALEDLTLPDDDRIIYSFHCYEPHYYTHQGAYWDDSIDKDVRMSFDEADIDGEYFDRLFEGAAAKAEREGRELYCGEYGVIDVVDPRDSLGWFRAISGAFERFGIARAVWSYREMDFGLADERIDEVREELLRCL